MKKIIAIIVAIAMVTLLAVPAFAADEYKAYIGFADSSWTHSMFKDGDYVAITGDGQYTLETSAFAGAADIIVFDIDIENLFADAPNASVVLDKIEIDGKEVAFDATRILYGDLEQTGTYYRIEIYDQFGGTAANPPINVTGLSVSSSIKVTFTVSGLGGGEAVPADEADDNDNNEIENTDNNVTAEPESTDSSAVNEPESTAPATGLAFAVVPAVIALAAAAISKKR